jgi:hypothetical protein
LAFDAETAELLLPVKASVTANASAEVRMRSSDEGI